MKINIFNVFSFIIILLLINLSHSNNGEKITTKGKCIYMISDSKAFNFHYLKSERDQNK